MMQVLTANDFRSGAVIYWGRQGWTRLLNQAEVFKEASQAEAGLEEAGLYPDQVVGAYLIEVETHQGRIRPLHTREVIRANGPSHEETNSTGGSVHVSL